MTAIEPVGRLHNLLQAALQQSEQKSIRQVWAAVLGIPENDHAAILFGIAETIILVREAKEAISRLEGVNTELYLKPFPQIERVFSNSNLDRPWNSARSPLDAATMYGLQIGSDAVSRVAPEPALTPDDLTAIQEKVDALYDQVIAADLPQQLRSIVLERLDEIRRALKNYLLWGTKGLARAVERAAGAAWVNSELFRAAADNETVMEFFRLLAWIHSAAKAVGGAKLIGEGLPSSSLGVGECIRGSA
jgi:hypothetical protein